MKRLGALAVALALIAGAIFINQAIHDDDSSSGEDTTATKVRVTCATEFAAACKTLDAAVTIEAPGTTADRLAAESTPGFDLWITSRPWPEIAALRSPRGTDRLGEPTELASSPLSLVALNTRATDLSTSCGGPPTGQCVMDASPKVGVTPVKQTQGLLALAFLLTGWPDLEDPGTGDIEANDRFVQELIGLKAKRVESSDPLTTILQLPKFEVALDLDVDRRLAGAARRNDFTATPTGITAVAVAVPAATTAGRAALERLDQAKLESALTDQGWSTDLPDDDGLPDPGVLDALASQWSPA